MYISPNGDSTPSTLRNSLQTTSSMHMQELQPRTNIVISWIRPKACVSFQVGRDGASRMTFYGNERSALWAWDIKLKFRHTNGSSQRLRFERLIFDFVYGCLHDGLSGQSTVLAKVVYLAAGCPAILSRETTGKSTSIAYRPCREFLHEATIHPPAIVPNSSTSHNAITTSWERLGVWFAMVQSQCGQRACCGTVSRPPCGPVHWSFRIISQVSWPSSERSFFISQNFSSFTPPSSSTSTTIRTATVAENLLSMQETYILSIFRPLCCCAYAISGTYWLVPR